MIVVNSVFYQEFKMFVRDELSIKSETPQLQLDENLNYLNLNSD